MKRGIHPPDHDFVGRVADCSNKLHSEMYKVCKKSDGRKSKPNEPLSSNEFSDTCVCSIALAITFQPFFKGLFLTNIFMVGFLVSGFF